MRRNLHIWLGSYIWQKAFSLLNGKPKVKGPFHVIFCFADHFEPDWGGADLNLQLKRVKAWQDLYPLIANRHKDADGERPKHTFFYPAEVYDSEVLCAIKEICNRGLGEVEIHLHHDHDTAESFRQKIIDAREKFAAHGLLGEHKKTGRIAFGFIHGNWALNNSRKDGKWCGVNRETSILYEEGCYADFTLPSAPSETQTTKINAIYYDIHNAHTQRQKSHNNGKDVAVNQPDPKALMIVQGPLGLNWKRRRLGLLPRIENGDISGNNPPTAERIDLWISQNINVKGKPHWIFVKVHTHGAPEKNAKPLLDFAMEELFSYLEAKYNDGKNYVLHYVSAREMYNIIKAAEAAQTGNPGEYRDYLIKKR